MNEDIKRLINNIIQNEFNHIQDENLKGMDDLEKYNLLNKEIDKIQDDILQALPEELKPLVNEWDIKIWHVLTIINDYYFRKGVIAGTSNLNFLRDSTGGIIFN